MQGITALADQQLQRVKVLCTQVGLQYADLPDQFVGVGMAIGFGPADYVIVSVMAGGNENQVMITDGVLNDLKQDRLSALAAANHFNQNNTAYPVFLHDAQAGWALIMQQTHPLDLLLDNPAYFNQCVRGLPQVVTAYRTTIAEKWDLGGQPWMWTDEDLTALLTRSML